MIRPSRARCIALVLTFGFIFSLTGARAEEASSPAAAVPIPAWRKTRIAGEFHKSFGSPRAEKKEGYGVGLAMLFPLTDSGFDLGVRYSTVKQDVNSFTLLTFVFDYYVFPSYVRGLYVGGEIGVTDPNAEEFFSVYNDYVFVGKVGYEYWVPNSRWSGAFELRRMVKTDDPIKPTSESRLYCNEMVISARYSL